ncbi:2-amino-4-hydroxy-6-hydroxymethyldihydropteridine diphosphokinase [Paenibacillus cremeus]|nr:2-amino-4-hydroxy-6-hydroxymethyldihydropteridine diphosphokinase [Paenibacillus cremeus]
MDSSKPFERAYLGLGSNMGDRERYLQEALRLLQEHPDVWITEQSGIYETDPVGFVDQDPFLNKVVQVGTTLSAEQLFQRMLEVEQALGRKREVRWGPRTIDLDMLLFGDLLQDRPDLILPHPRMMERAFVLVPLIEIMRSCDPFQAEQLSRQLERVEGKEGVTLWKRMQ